MKQIVLVLTFIITVTTTAQDYRFGKVDAVDFEQQANDGDELPPAEVLYRKEHISFNYSQGNGFRQKRSIHERIKINTEEGLDYATKQVRLYNESNSKRERLKSLKGYTFVQDGKRVGRVKLRSSGEFEEEVNEYWKRSSFTMPDVRVGSIIEFEYYIDSPFMTIDDVILQYDIPIRKMDLRIEMLEYYSYNVLFNPRASYVPDLQRSVAADKIRTTSKQRSGSGMSPTSTNFSAQQYELSNEVLVVDTKDIPALQEEPMSGTMSKYRAKIIFELAAVKFPNEPVKYLSVNWESVSKSIYDHKMFGDQLNKRPFYEEELSKALSGATTPQAKASQIFNYVKNNVKWNGYYGITSQNGLKDAFKDGSGNVADVNLLLTSMLNSQGIEAYPMLISTRDNGIPLFPTRDGFNYVVTVAKIDDRMIMMDATDDNLGIGKLPLRAMNWQGRVVQADGRSFWMDLTPKEPSEELIMSTVSLYGDLNIIGKTQKRLTNQMAYSYRDDYRNRPEESIVKYIKGNTPGFEVSNVEVKDVDAIDKPVGLAYDINLNSAAEKIGDKIYVTPLLNELNDENPFKLEDRKLPVVLGYPLATKTIVNLDIPEGYEIASMPESVQYNYNGGKGSYRYVVSEVAGKINVLADFKMNDVEVLPSDYPMWKEFFTAIVAKDAEKIVLKKI
jgi:hypothetical protein